MIDPEILKYYADLLIVQYNNLAKARGNVELMVNQATCDGLAQDENLSFTLADAIGAQLDILGRIVGVPRNVQGLIIGRTYYNFTTYLSPASNGFASYADAVYPSDILWLRYSDITNASYTLLDSEMRTLIALKIALNTRNSSTKDINDILWEFFGSDVEFIDNQDMTITYNISTDIQQVMEIAVFLEFLPKPMGVSKTVNYV
ncbi:MAG: DUF2612 domain-containing protein [Deltaproteobacteria bacterium]|nr:DUF2612 domain-containing protein [Deltaproteobacteria bacterium]